MGVWRLGGATLYGMTQSGGTVGWGNVFSVSTNGTNYRDLVPFSGTGGGLPKQDLGPFSEFGNQRYYLFMLA